VASTGTGSSVSIGQIFAIVCVLLVVFFGVYFVGSLVRRRRKRKDSSKFFGWGDSLYRDGYRDEPGSGINIAPRRSSSVYDGGTVHGNSVSMHSSSTDPMATALAPKPLAVPAEADDGKEPEPQPTVYIGPPRDEDGHVLHNVDIC
jgi:hypothetical protein